MKNWALVVAGLYGLILVALTVPITSLAFVPKLTVSLLSFGPAVFFLYVNRWRRLHPNAASPAIDQ